MLIYLRIGTVFLIVILFSTIYFQRAAIKNYQQQLVTIKAFQLLQDQRIKEINLDFNNERAAAINKVEAIKEIVPNDCNQAIKYGAQQGSILSISY